MEAELAVLQAKLANSDAEAERHRTRSLQNSTTKKEQVGAKRPIAYIPVRDRSATSLHKLTEEPELDVDNRSNDVSGSIINCITHTDKTESRVVKVIHHSDSIIQQQEVHFEDESNNDEV